MSLKVPDISNWQDGIDIDAVISQSDGVIIKASEHTSFKDRCFERWAKAISDSGKPLAFYHFFRGDGISEADWFLQVVGDYIHKGHPIIDVEVPCTIDQIRKFVDRVHEKTGKWCWFYTSAAFISQYMDSYLKEKCPLWCAGYPQQYTSWTNDKFPYSQYTDGCRVIGWQFTSTLLMAGWSIDASLFYISKEEWTGDAAPAPKPDPEPSHIPSGSTMYLAVNTMLGQYGNGEERKRKLGDRYREVQDFIDHIYHASTDILADEVINGKYGNGNTREILLGDRYEEVQSAVNRKFQTNLDDIAMEVIEGKWGNGEERRKRLESAGYDYQAVQDIVNEMLS